LIIEANFASFVHIGELCEVFFAILQLIINKFMLEEFGASLARVASLVSFENGLLLAVVGYIQSSGHYTENDIVIVYIGTSWTLKRHLI